jgi:hypothetical protein
MRYLCQSSRAASRAPRAREITEEHARYNRKSFISADLPTETESILPLVQILLLD